MATTTREAAAEPNPPDPEIRRIHASVGALRAWVVAHWIDVAIVAAISVLIFPDSPRFGSKGLDPSWITGLDMAANARLAFGREVLFSYGPLGFASVGWFHFTAVWLVAVAVLVASDVAVVALSYHLLRRVLSRWAAAALLAVGLPFVLYSTAAWGVITENTVQFLAVLIAFAIVTSSGPIRWWVLVASGALVGAALLIKLDSGVLCGAIIGVAVLARSLVEGSARLAVRRLAVLGGATVVSIVVLWVVLGQPLGDLLLWMRGALEIASGYSASMGFEGADRTGQWAIALLLVGWLVVGTAFTRDVDSRRRWAVVSVVVVLSYFLLRRGFVRHDLRSCLPVLFFVPVALAAMWGWRRATALALTIIALLTVLTPIDVTQNFAVGARIRSIADSARLAASPTARTELTDLQRSRLREQLGIHAELLAPASGETIHISPWEIDVAYAFPDLIWQPLPVFQDYAAYTTRLDQLNADALAAEGRPTFILRNPGIAVDDRVPRWEPPQATVEMICRYRVVGAQVGWQLLEASRDRCGDLRLGDRRDTEFGEAIAAPDRRGDELVVARFSGINTRLDDKLRTLAFKSREYYVDVGDGRWHRFVPGTQGGWHVLRAPPCLAQELDAGQPDIGTITFSSSGQSAEGEDPVSVEFATIPVTC